MALVKHCRELEISRYCVYCFNFLSKLVAENVFVVYDALVILTDLNQDLLVLLSSICWFKLGLSDSRRFKNASAPLIRVPGLGLLDSLLCPHYHSEKYDKDRVTSLKTVMKRTSGKALAIDDFCAVAVVDGSYKVMTSKPGAYAYKVYRKRGKCYIDLQEKHVELE